MALILIWCCGHQAEPAQMILTRISWTMPALYSDNLLHQVMGVQPLRPPTVELRMVIIAVFSLKSGPACPVLLVL